MSVTGERIAPAVERLLVELSRRRLGEVEPSPLTFTQQIGLAVIVDEGPLRLRTLAHRIGTTAATATRTADALEAAGLVERRPDPADGRGVLVSATRTGSKTRRDSHTLLVMLLDRILEQLDEDDRQRFVQVMIDLHEIVEAAEHGRLREQVPSKAL
jgi:DNA-binding MarR family transcriptional regulator